MTRRVNWAQKHEGCHETDSYDEEEEHINRVHAHSFEPTYVTVSQQDERLKKIESILSKLDLSSLLRPTSSYNRSPSPRKKKETNYTGNCFHCDQQGHFAKQCPRMKLISNSAESNEETEDIGKAIKITQLGKETRGITIPIRINNISTKAAVDTGADATVISEDVAREAKLDFETGTNCKLLNAANNAEMIAYGGVTAIPKLVRESGTGRYMLPRFVMEYYLEKIFCKVQMPKS